MLFPIILSGGIGSRLWPLSREHYPKQLLALVGDNTLLQDTLLRLQGLPDLSRPLIICHENHRFLVAEQLRQLYLVPHHIVLEPIGRNTAPAAAVAALLSLVHDDDPLLLILPADHVIQNVTVFQTAILAGIPLAQADYLVTFGVVPTQAHTGYGYIQAGHSINDQAFQVQQFVEKPDAATAEQYLQQGHYYWNSGMFLFRAKQYLLELEQFAPNILGACRQAVQNSLEDKDFLRLDKGSFKSSPSDSIDYAVMEHTQNAAVIPLAAGWNDVGSWTSLWEASVQDDQGNVFIGDVVAEAVKNCYLRSEYRLVAGLGIEDLVVIETADAILVAHKDTVQTVKQIVNRLKQEGREEVDLHRKVYRPWGSYENIDIEERFKVKRITVKPGASLSLQLHYHRSEHWVVVKGTAKITQGEKTAIITENQSTYIPVGVLHRLENPGHIPLEIIEIQSGSYLGEEDIIRFEDNYGR